MNSSIPKGTVVLVHGAWPTDPVGATLSCLYDDRVLQ